MLSFLSPILTLLPSLSIPHVIAAWLQSEDRWVGEVRDGGNGMLSMNFPSSPSYLCSRIYIIDDKRNNKAMKDRKDKHYKDDSQSNKPPTNQFFFLTPQIPSSSSVPEEFIQLVTKRD